MDQQESQEMEIDLLELLVALWQKRLKIFKYGIVGGLIGIVVAFSIPKVYTSRAIVVPEMENSSNSTRSINSLAALAGVDFGEESVGITVRTYPEIVSSTPFIFEFAEMPVTIEDRDGVREVSLVEYFTQEYKSPWWSHIIGAPMKALGAVMSLFKENEEEEFEGGINIKRLSKEQLSYRKVFAEQVYLSMDSKTYIMSLEVNTQSPEVSLMLADQILEKLQEYMTYYKTSKIRSELSSNLCMLNEAQAKYYHADSVYAAATDRAKNVTSNLARISLDRLMNEKNMTYQIYSQLASKVEMNKTRLNAETPILTIVEPATFAIKASSPRKQIIVVAFGFLGGVIAVIPTLFAILYGKKEEEESGDIA